MTEDSWQHKGQKEDAFAGKNQQEEGERSFFGDHRAKETTILPLGCSNLMIILSMIMISVLGNPTLVDLSNESDSKRWVVVDDGVMGGRSNGDFVWSAEGYGTFYGTVSLENNGGFSSVRYILNRSSVSDYSGFKLTVKGDGKPYQFRVKRNRMDRHSYMHRFETNGEWQEVIVPMNAMTPTFRGMTPRIPNYKGKSLQEIGFLVGNKRAESFSLQIKKIELVK